MLSIFLVGDPRAVIAPMVFPKRLLVDKGRERLARPIEEVFLPTGAGAPIVRFCDGMVGIEPCRMFSASGYQLEFFINELSKESMLGFWRVCSAYFSSFSLE